MHTILCTLPQKYIVVFCSEVSLLGESIRLWAGEFSNLMLSVSAPEILMCECWLQYDIFYRVLCLQANSRD